MYLRNFLFFLLFLPVFVYGQYGALKTIVKDNINNEPIIGASVSLLSPTSKAYLRGGQTDENGRIQIEQVSAGKYVLKISYVGMVDFIQENVEIEDGLTLELGEIVLTEVGKQIEAVVVQGKVPELQLGIDKKVFDVSQSTVSIGGTAQDLLGNVPTLQLDIDGNVSLRGSTARILIDGKESAMAGGDISRLLQSLPANAIAKVEIITNPSSKYDAEGQSGIVNIILKKNIRTGLNGTVTTSVGNYDNYVAGVDLNYRDSKVNYFGGYSFNHRKNVGERTTKNIQLFDGAELPSSERTITQNENYRKGKNHAFRLGADYYAAEKTTISVSSNLSVRDNDRGEDIVYNYRNLPRFGNVSTRNARQSEQDLGYDISLDFKQGLKREGEELSANVTFGNDREDGTNDFIQRYDIDRRNDVRNNVTGENGRNWNFQLDYVLPFGPDHKLEAGYRTMIRNGNEYQYSDTLHRDGMMVPDYYATNDFEMQSGVHALYVNYQRKLTERLGAQVGLRAEDAYLNTLITGRDPDQADQPKSNRGKLDYFRVYPTAFFTYRVGPNDDKIQLSYSSRVQRPRGWQVNPFINLSDETNLRQGNPNLMPEFIHSLEMSFAKFYSSWNFIASTYYRRVNGMVQPYQYERENPITQGYLDSRPNATFSRWENVGNRDNLGIEIVSKVTLFKWWDATLNLNGFYNKVTPYKEFNQGSVDNFSWSSNVTTNVKVTPTLSAQIRGDYRSSMKAVQGTFKSMTGVDVAIRQDVLKGKGSVVFNVRDLFDKRRFGSEIITPTRYLDNNIRWSKRMFNLSFVYRFGTQDLNKSKNKQNGTPEDMGGGEY